MRVKRGAYQPRIIDRAVFAILAVLHMANGIYVTGPWYLDTWNDAGKAPLQNAFNSDTAVSVYGVLLFLNGLALLYAAAAQSATKHYTQVLSCSLVSGFLLRLYSLIGVFIALESWRPPSYLSHVATVFLLGAYWVWVRVNVRPVQ